MHPQVLLAKKGLRKCNVCKKIKPLQDFYRRKNGYYYYACKKCISDYGAHFYRQNPEKKKTAAREWRKRNPEKVKEMLRNYYDTHREQTNNAHRKRKRMIKQKIVDMLGGKCQRCGYARCLAALEFHHKDPTVKEHSLEMNKRELVNFDPNKYELVCANCHRENS